MACRKHRQRSKNQQESLLLLCQTLVSLQVFIFTLQALSRSCRAHRILLPFIIKILQVKFCHHSCCHDRVQHLASPSEVDGQPCQGGTDKSRSSITDLYCHCCCCNSDSTCEKTLSCQNSGFYAVHPVKEASVSLLHLARSREILTNAVCAGIMVRF